MAEIARTARALLRRESVGVLSTHSADVEGYPFGSIVPYVVDHAGAPAILISDIAQHTRNVERDPRVSLTVFDRTAADPQAGARLTWIGDAAPIDPADVETPRRYSRQFPSSDGYFATHGFAFYRLSLRRARFIGGFGQIAWIEPRELLAPNPFRASEAGIVDHMNRDHAPALDHYCRALAGVAPSHVVMTGIDAEGFDMLADGRKVRIDFDVPIGTEEEARSTLVRLLREGRSAP
jgi:putative heme iron utilization protein